VEHGEGLRKSSPAPLAVKAKPRITGAEKAAVKNPEELVAKPRDKDPARIADKYVEPPVPFPAVSIIKWLDAPERSTDPLKDALEAFTSLLSGERGGIRRAVDFMASLAAEIEKSGV
jgi:hypothetical protein